MLVYDPSLISVMTSKFVKGMGWKGVTPFHYELKIHLKRPKEARAKSPREKSLTHRFFGCAVFPDRR